jgi:hypothetical protein
MEDMIQNINFPLYDNVFCDSLEALEWAYDNGLSRDALIRTSSPKMLWSQKPNIIHVESHWNVDRMKEFQTTIKRFSEDIYDRTRLIESFSHEESLCVSQVALQFHRILFKAACLNKEDLIEPRLFISIDGNGGHNGNNINSPWAILLGSNPNFRNVTYTLKDDKWDTLTTNGVPIWNRMRIGGLETVVYRMLIKIMAKLPNFFFNKQVLVINESELLIETASSLALSWVQIKKIKPNKTKNISIDENKLSVVKGKISPVVFKRIRNWVDDDFVSILERIFFRNVEEKLKFFWKSKSQWQDTVKECKHQKKVLLINAPGNIKWSALTSVCREYGIPVVSTQHGVTHEICATHGEVSSKYDINFSDLFLAYNLYSKKISESSYFSRGNSCVVGISARHIRMRESYYFRNRSDIPIAYVSTNLYRGNLSAFSTWKTDYDRSLCENRLISDVFGRLPHKVLYKAYPEENRRYADHDPVIETIHTKENIELFNSKVDMRYLLRKHRILITSIATSTIGWLVMSEKPVVFINRYADNPLTKEAHVAFSKGLFLFDDIDKNFHENLYKFLSLPIDKIEELWKKKEVDRNYMINHFFTSSSKKNSGKISAKMIMERYFKH